MDTLPPLKSLSGHDAYCHVCWEDFYALWVDKSPPPNHECAMGAASALECPNAMGRARSRAFFAKQDTTEPRVSPGMK